jgi:hypothetical protein
MIHARIFAFVLGIALTNVVIAGAQESNTTSDTRSTPNAIQVVDQLIEQNQQLEKQNRQIEKQNQQLEKQNQQLMEQIKVLRGAVAQRADVSEQAAEAASAQATADVTADVKVEQTGAILWAKAEHTIFNPKPVDAILNPKPRRWSAPTGLRRESCHFRRIQSGPRIYCGPGQVREAESQWLYRCTVSKPVARRAVSYRPLGTPDQGHSSPGLPVPSGHVVFSRMAVQSQIPIFYVPLDGAGHESGGGRRRRILQLR